MDEKEGSLAGFRQLKSKTTGDKSPPIALLV